MLQMSRLEKESLSVYKLCPDLWLTHELGICGHILSNSVKDKTAIDCSCPHPRGARIRNLNLVK